MRLNFHRPLSLPPNGWAARGWRAAVLLEVVVALALFVAASVVLGVALNASVGSVERLRLNAHASDLAITILSEIQLGLKTPTPTEPQPFEPPFTNWTWQTVEAPLEGGAPAREEARTIEVAIRSDDPPLVFRFSQMLRIGNPASDPAILDPARATR